jgi:hypothetical protein
LIYTNNVALLGEEKAHDLQKYQPLATKAEHDPAVKHPSPEETSENDGFATSPLEIPQIRSVIKWQPRAQSRIYDPAILLGGKLLQG